MGRRRREAGETLVEILVSVAILGIVAVGVVGALGSDIIISAADRKTSTAEPVLRSFAAYLDRTLGGASGYKPCAAGQTTNPYYGASAGQWTSPTLGYSAPSGVTATVTGWGPSGGVTWWNGTTAGTTAAVFSTTCPLGGDQGLQQLSIRVQAGDGAAQSATIQVRKP